jgi:hypothetical protein
MWALGALVYRYRDASGQEHFVSDPSLAPPEARATLQPVDLRQAPVTSVSAPPSAMPSGMPDAGAAASLSPVPSGTVWHRTWTWAALVSLSVFLVFAVSAMAVSERFQGLSWALHVGRYVAFLLLAATILAASYELRDDPALQRYSPWALLNKVQQARQEAVRRETPDKATLEQSEGSSRTAR